MNRYFDLHFNRNIVTIYPGEFWSSTGPEMISTVLGSCVSIALFDPIAGVGGMNHFMLAKDTNQEIDGGFPNSHDKLLGRFGEYAVEMLISDMEKKGAQLSRCTAKVFGGGNIFNTASVDGRDLVGESNIKFAFDYLKKNNIEVKSSDTGGNSPRKIFFDPVTSKVFLRHIDSRTENDNQFLKSKEDSYIETLKHLADLNRAAKGK